MRKSFAFLFTLISVCFFIKSEGSTVSDLNKVLQVDRENKNLKIQNIFQDQQGFVWVGTEHGLYLYDGFEFEIGRAHV